MIGKLFAQYEIVSSLGAGGMGEVYEALDTKLGRRVALKLLPEIFSHDPERVARFEREARILASLNHTNIAGLYGLEQSNGKHCLAMELVEGETLAERIARGPVPVEEVVKISCQIADALEAAHAKAIVHRDLKPANVKITPEGKAKVLDFGLAKALNTGDAKQDILSSPTLLSAPATNAGVILGTAAYMSPEQARGMDADERSDIFSFGCILFEMLTGRRSFDGRTLTDTIASVLARDPDLKTLPQDIHPGIHDVLRRCLEKDEKRRWQAIGDVRVELESIASDPRGINALRAQAKPSWWKLAAPAAVTGIIAILLTAAFFLTRPAAPPPATVARFSFTLPKDLNFTRTGRHVVTISPDGTNIVYVANRQLYLRPLTDMEPHAIPGTAQDVNTPFFSPDGRWLAFNAVPEKKLKKIALTGGADVTICDIENPYGATWYDADHILVGQGPKGIVRVSANGGKPETVISVKQDEFAHEPQVLPGGDEVMFTLARGTAIDRWDKAQIVVQSLKTGRRKTLIQGGSDARFVAGRYIVYVLGNNLFAVPFDVRKLEVTGGPVPILENVMKSASTTTAATFFAFSDNGTLVSVPGTQLEQGKVLAMVDKAASKKPIPLPASPFREPRISPDGKQLAVGTDDGKDANIWIYDLSGAASMRRLTFTGANVYPVWTRDGQRIVFQSDRDGDKGLFWQRADGSGAAERLTTAAKDETQYPLSWTPDGKTLAFFTSHHDDVWMVSIDGDRKPKALIEAPGYQGQATFSPDGRWIAYTSVEGSGSVAIYVQPFPPTGAKYLVSAVGGLYPSWSPDGKQLYYMQSQTGGPPPWKFMSVDVVTQPSFAFSKPTILPIEGLTTPFPSERPYDVMPDGKQFLAQLAAAEASNTEAPPQQINVVLNWYEELKQRVPLK